MNNRRRCIEKEVTSSTSKGKSSKRKLTDKIEKKAVRRRKYSMDLRIHSPSSLGYLGIAGVDTANALVRLAKIKGLDTIALTDFYSGDFVDEVKEAASSFDLRIIPGTVIRGSVSGCSDVILACLFPEECKGESVNKFLNALHVSEKHFGDERYLVELPFERILSIVDKYSAVAIPSRMDKTPYRMAAIPTLVEDYGFRAFDLAYGDSESYFKNRWPKINFQLFGFSNSQALAQIGSRIAKVKMSAPGFQGIQELVARA